VPLLGEIVKNTQALQYHAKSAEVAGKNLTHINDENYARQRVVSRDGSMYREVGSLSTSALEMGGLDHARSEMLDRRVITEVGESASLEARKEILDLLQAALGERVTRQGVNATLDDQHDSDLAPGSLTRAINDFFNTFQELSASPDEIAIRQQLYHKVHTLGKRFNEAGQKFEDIEADLTATAGNAVSQVNAILEKLHEVNKQIRRFELQGKGLATSYRDRRQQLLESLAKLMDVRVEDDFEIDPTTKEKKASGLINLFATGVKGEKVNLLAPDGAKKLSMDWNQEFNVEPPSATGGTSARVRAKIGTDGKLGRVEVLDGGSKYSDEDGPILVAFAPPERKETLVLASESEPTLASAKKGDGTTDFPVSDGARYSEGTGTPQSVEVSSTIPNAPADLPAEGSGFDLSGVAPVVTITGSDKGSLSGNATVNADGSVKIKFSGTPAGLSDLKVEVAQGAGGGVEPLSLTVKGVTSTGVDSSVPFAYNKGEVFNYQGSYYQALSSTGKGANLSDTDKFLKITSIPSGPPPVSEFLNRFSAVKSHFEGEQFYKDGKLFQTVGDIAPVVVETGANDLGRVVSSQAYVEGDVFLYKENYYLIRDQEIFSERNKTKFAKGEIVLTELEGLAKGESTPAKRILALGKNLPKAYHPTENPDGVRTLKLSGNDPVVKGEYLFDSNSKKYYVATETFDPDSGNLKSSETGAFDWSKGKTIEVTTNVKFVDQSITGISKLQSTRIQEGEILFDDASETNAYYFVKRSFELKSPEAIKNFVPSDPQWGENLHKFTPALASPDTPGLIITRSNPIAFDPADGQAVELNLGLAEAIVQKGEIVGFNILNQGGGYPSTNALFVDGLELDLNSGAIHGYQRVHLEEMESFRQNLNGLAEDFVTKVNQLYNPDDEPGGYVFSFDAYLGRATQGANTYMEDEFGIVGEEGNGEFTLFREEVEMTLPYPENETFSLVVSSNIFPDHETFAGTPVFQRADETGRGNDDEASLIPVYAYGAARRMKHVTIEDEIDFPGVDQIPGNDDDGRNILHGYEKIPYRMQQGTKAFVIGDNFHFDAVPANSWNIAKSLRVDAGFSVDSVKASQEEDGDNELALAIAELGNGGFTDQVSSMNTNIGNSLSDVGDNLDHQKAVERLLLDERQAVSSVSIDEEVADLMRFQRSYQASAKVLSTLDKMLEIVVMGLTR
jgi:flagellar hook-associated protein FlgK